jgi:hypothetical protein
MSIMDFSSIIRKRQCRKRACKDCNIASDTSNFFPLLYCEMPGQERSDGVRRIKIDL